MKLLYIHIMMGKKGGKIPSTLHPLFTLTDVLVVVVVVVVVVVIIIIIIIIMQYVVRKYAYKYK